MASVANAGSRGRAGRGGWMGAPAAVGLACALPAIGAAAWLPAEGQDVGAVMLGLHDARDYFAIGLALWAGDVVPSDLFAQRGPLYPLVAVGLHAVAPVVLVVVQAVLLAAGAACLAAIERNTTGKVRFTWLTACCVSLWASAIVMMTEAAAFAAGAAALLLATSERRRGYSAVALTLGAMTKASFWPVAVLAVGAQAVRLRRNLVPVALSVALIGAHAGWIGVVAGSVTLSSAAGDNFDQRFFPAVHGEAVGGDVVYMKDVAAAESAARFPTRADKVRFVAFEAPFAALRAWGKILWRDHLAQASGFVARDNKAMASERRQRLSDVSRVLNPIVFAAAGLGLIGLWQWARRQRFDAWPAAILPPLLILSAPLVYWQGDRIVMLPAALLLPFAGCLLSGLPRGRRTDG